jgi:hypothetical protein
MPISLETVTASGLLAAYNATLEQTPGYVAARDESIRTKAEGVGAVIDRWEDPFGQLWSAVVTQGEYPGCYLEVIQPKIWLKETSFVIDTPPNQQPFLLFERHSGKKRITHKRDSDAIPGNNRILRRLQAGATPQEQ